MHTRLTIVLTTSLLLFTPTSHAEIRWGVPPQYAQPDTTTADNTPAIEETPQAPPPKTKDDKAIEEELNQEVRILWDEIHEMEQRQNDITILPIDTPPPTEPTPPKKINKPKPTIKNEKERIDTLLHSTKDKNGKIIPLPKEADTKNTKDNKNNKDLKKTPAPTVNLPQLTAQPKPVLTRKQVLEQEIAREKAALKSAQTQLQIAQKRGNAAQIQKLNTMIRDRELNVQSISRELTR